MWREFCDSQYARTPARSEIAAAIDAVVAAADGATIAFPLGLFHGDHALAHEAAMATVRRQPRRRWLIYEDALYRCLPGIADEQLARLAGAGLTLEPRHDAGPAAVNQKRRAVACYRSQLRALRATRGTVPVSEAFGPERYWRVRP